MILDESSDDVLNRSAEMVIASAEVVTGRMRAAASLMSTSQMDSSELVPIGYQVNQQ